MGVTTTKTNKPFSPRGNDQSPLAFNRAKLFSGKALDFDGGNDLVNTTYSSGFTGAQEFTYCVYVNAHTNQQNQTIIHGNENVGWGLQSLQVRTETNGIRFFAGTGSSSTSYVDSDPIEANKWYFVVGTHTPTENKIYLNGALNATATAANLTAAPQAITIGAYPWATVAFNGEISSPRIFNTALTAAQVADLYNNPEKVVPTGVDNTALKLWLPMMEGAGTTAYDGSGNGNHGTISGATYVNGVGAPSPQSAVMDWNKGSNLVPDVNNFNSANEVTTTTGLADDPAGRSNAVRFTKTTDTTPRYGFQTCGSATLLGNTDYVISLFYKYDGHAFTSSIEYNNSGHFDLSWACNLNIAASGVTIAGAANCTGKVVEYSNDWYRVDVELTTGASPSGNPQYLVKMQGNTGTSLLVAYAQLEQASSVGPLVPTFGTAQPTPVLLPQGLTSGRDITGVNLFENVRKQGALNLDGNSWAEVHDNASLDFGTGSFTFEAWAKYSYVSQGSSLNAILSLGGDIGQGAGYGRAGLVSSSSGSSMSFFYNSTGNASTSSFSDGDWVHVVGVYDETSVIIYINGAEERTTARTAASMTNTDVKQIGRDSTAIRYYNDQIAQPRIYNRALTAEEVQRNYNSGKNTYK